MRTRCAIERPAHDVPVPTLNVQPVMLDRTEVVTQSTGRASPTTACWCCRRRSSAEPIFEVGCYLYECRELNMLNREQAALTMKR